MSYDAPPPSPPYGSSPYGGAPAPSNNNKSVWALVCGILGILCCGLLGIPAIIMGRQAQAQGGPNGRAKAGEVLGYIAIALLVVGIVLFALGVLSFGTSNN
jgi:hypothetical protein